MRGLAWVGVLLVVIGIGVLAVRSFSYTTTEKVVDIGPIHATKDTTHSVPIPPILSGLALIGGVVCLVAASKSSS